MVFEHTRCTIFQGSYCDTDHYPVVADIRKTLTVSKQAERKFSVETFNLRKLNEAEVMK